jgi:hypothetical protein
MAELRDELREEWLLLQKTYEEFDARALGLKGLATPLLGAGYAAGAENGSTAILVATMVVAACLWALETIWKTFQYGFAERIRALEAYFREPEACADYKPYQVFYAWTRAYDAAKGDAGHWWRMATRPFVLLPYAPMLLAGAALIAAQHAGGTPA